MSAEAMTVAEAITPGPSAAATQKVLIAAWAFAESVNDYKLLLKGHKIPIMKNEAKELLIKSLAVLTEKEKCWEELFRADKKSSQSIIIGRKKLATAITH